MPTKQLLIRRLTCISPDSAVIALGSEMSGGIEDVRAEDIVAINSESGIRYVTTPFTHMNRFKFGLANLKPINLQD